MRYVMLFLSSLFGVLGGWSGYLVIHLADTGEGGTVLIGRGGGGRFLGFMSGASTCWIIAAVLLVGFVVASRPPRHEPALQSPFGVD